MTKSTSGIVNWNKHWKGKGNIVTTVRKPSPYFKDPKNSSTRVDYLTPSRDDAVIYIDVLSQEMEKNQSRVAFQFGNVYNPQEDVYYVQIDALRKPASKFSGAFKPQTFGLADQEFTLSNYISTLKNSIISRQDITGDLEEYLLALVDYAHRTTPISEFQINDFEDGALNAVRNDFGECIGPIYAIQRGLTTYGLGVNSNSTIEIPSNPNEPTLDYYIITGPPVRRKIKISAKSGGVSSNTLKVDSLIDLILQNSTLQNEIEREPYKLPYTIMKTIQNNSFLMGPIECVKELGYIDSNAVNTISGLRATNKIPNPELFLNVLQKDSYLKSRVSRLSSKIRSGDYSGVNITLNELSHACEKLVIKYSSEKSTYFSHLIKTALANDIFFVYFTLNGLNPHFSTSKARTDKVESGQTLANLVLRSKNGYNSTKNEKLGFNVN